MAAQSFNVAAVVAMVLIQGAWALSAGQYFTATDSVARDCPVGHYCVAGIKHACPSGAYGMKTRLDSASCSGQCEEGFYCESGSTSPRQKSCPLDTKSYCPSGSKIPTPVGLGYYAVSLHDEDGGGYGGEKGCTPGYYCISGVRYACPSGRYGNRMLEFNASCTGVCSAGWYCPEASTSKFERSCGDTDLYCPHESSAPLQVDVGYYTVGAVEDPSQFGEDMENYNQGEARTSQHMCEAGYYCRGDGIKRVCPKGRYGSKVGEYSPRCSGSCKEGFYCPERSTSETQHECGSHDKFCPSGSYAPHIVVAGYYTVPASNLPYDAIGNVYQAKERKCEPGYYCEEGIKALCEKGYWGSEYGLIDPHCSGICQEGFYCPEGSTSPTEVMCGDANVYCESGAWKPVLVSAGYYSIGGGDMSTRTGQTRAQRGSYGLQGVQYTCQAGIYGMKDGLATPECTGACDVAGYYCPPGSIYPTQHLCGGDDRICAAGAVAPVIVLPGFYTVDYSSRNNAERAECGPGQYRNWTGLSHDVTLEDGIRSPIETFKTVPACELCPEGTFKALGGDSFEMCMSCPFQSVCTTSKVVCECMQQLHPDDGTAKHFHPNGTCLTIDEEVLANTKHDGFYAVEYSALTRSVQMECEPGYFCIGGKRYPCTPGSYGSSAREMNPTCSGLCKPGYYCGEASTSPMANVCGDASVYCPEGSFTPIYTSAGYYTDESDLAHLRSNQLPCPTGHYCYGGFHEGGADVSLFDGLRHTCSPGTYADVEMVASKECRGLCDLGHYCSEGSSDRRQNQCGGPGLYCPRGSAIPEVVHDGFYGSHSGNAAGTSVLFDKGNNTYSVEIPCEPSYYCSAGIKYPCPPGRFGWKYGMQTAECGGKCPPGFYCPSYLNVQPEAPEHTVWPHKPHVSSSELECGDNSWYCPEGSFYPIKVRGGYYTEGGDSDKGSRTRETICPTGSYCVNGVKYPCPAKRFGDVEGLPTFECSGWCPSSYYCPLETSVPILCPPTEFSTGAMDSCNPCPGDRQNPLPCQNDRICCYQGDLDTPNEFEQY